MHKKASLELSTNIIVVMIICLMLMGVGLYLLVQGGKIVDNYEDQLKAQHERELWKAMDTGKQVILYPNDQIVKRGENAFFTLGIDNQLLNSGSQDFYVLVDPSNMNGIRAQYIPGPYQILNNQRKSVKLVFPVAKASPSKTSSLFKVYVCLGSCTGYDSDTRRYDNQYGDSQLAQVNVK